MTPMVKTERVDVRLPSDLKQLIERAATLCGQTITDFILGLTVPRAREVIREADITELTNRDRDIFLAMLDDDEPNEAMRRAAERYQATVA